MTAKTRNLVLLGVVLALLIIFPFVVPRPNFWVVSVGIRSLWLGIVSMSLIWLAKSTGLLSLGQLTFWGTTAYAIAILSAEGDMPFMLSIPIAVVLATVLGFIVALITVRTQGVYFLMLTLAVSQLAYFYVLNAATLTGGYGGIGGIERPALFGLELGNRNVMYFVGLTLAVATFLLCRYVSRTPFGLALEGIRDSPQRMEALGYNIYWYKVAAFTFSAFIASISGVLATFYYGRITPGAVDLVRSIDILIVSVLGGIGSIGGAFIGATGLTTLQNFAQSNALGIRRLTLTGLIFVAVLLFFPGGIVGLKDQAIDGYNSLRARRERSSTPQDTPAGATAATRRDEPSR